MSTSVAELAADAFTHPWILWVTLAVAMATLEMLVPAFGFIFASAAALLTVPVALALGWASQLASFSLLLIASLTLVRPRLMSRLQTSKGIPSPSARLIGKTGKVTVAIEPDQSSGRVLVEGQDWAARGPEPLPAGQSVVIDGADGIVLLVRSLQ